MDDDLYNKRILALAAEIPHTVRLVDPQASQRRESRLCGSRVTVDVNLKDGRIAEFGQEVRACALGQASAAILGHGVLGCDRATLAAARDGLKAMLKQGAAPPEGPFAELEVLQPAAGYPARHASILLPFEATLAALDALGAQDGTMHAAAEG